MQSLSRALAVLDTLSTKGQEMSLGELHNELNMPKSTLHRLLSQLSKHRFVAKAGPPVSYRVGPRLLSLAADYVASSNLIRFAKPLLTTLASYTGQTVYLAALEGRDIVCLDSLDLSNGLRMYVRIGRVLPPHAASSAKAILAYLPQAHIDDILDNADLVKFHESTVVDRNVLDRELETTRKRGWAESFNEVDPGVHAFSAPIFSFGHRVCASVAFMGVAERMQPEATNRHLSLLIKSANQISELLGHKGATENAD